MERELFMAGIGGQGVQLVTKILAHALNLENRYVMHFAEYGGTMRGGNVECTVITGTSELLAPPIIPSVWLSVTMHPEGVAKTREKLRKGSLYVVNSSLVKGERPPVGVTLIEIPASEIAAKIDNVQGAAMIMTAAICRAAGLVAKERLLDGLKALTPSYRARTIEQNAGAFEAGDAYARESMKSLRIKAWEPVAA
jgi:2-oxoglutarate ferredoxin oxidoreductase subunit gamma